jgi:heat shock protein HslJ
VSVNPSLTLEGPLWRLTRYRADASKLVSAQTYGSQNPSLQLVGGRLSGHGTCNRFFGRYQIDGVTLRLLPGGSTMMACSPAAMAQEQVFLEALAQVSRYGLVDAELQLFDASSNLLLAFCELVPPVLIGNLWELIAYNNGRGGVTSVLTGTRITATFDDAGHMAGSAGCNHYRASYSVVDELLSISSVASTRKHCPEPESVMEQEAAYLQALATVATYCLEDNHLTLKTDTGATVVRFGLASDGTSQ